MAKRNAPSTSKSAGKAPAKEKRRCGLCGKTSKLTRTECCGQWVCNDEENYVLFSYARNSCSRSHSRYTLCGYHFNEGHKGRWQDCKACRSEIEPEMVAYYGTNEYNFEKLADPPKFEPTKCGTCGRVIDLGRDGYMMNGTKKYCTSCAPL